MKNKILTYAVNTMALIIAMYAFWMIGGEILASQWKSGFDAGRLQAELRCYNAHGKALLEQDRTPKVKKAPVKYAGNYPGAPNAPRP